MRTSEVGDLLACVVVGDTDHAVRLNGAAGRGGLPGEHGFVDVLFGDWCVLEHTDRTVGTHGFDGWIHGGL